MDRNAILCEGRTMDDCIIIGGGPAGLTAAIYLARYHLNIRLFDCGNSRAAMIPCTRNHAGYPEGIAGSELIARMLAQAQKFGTVREDKRVTQLSRGEEGFSVHTAHDIFQARTVLIATGVVNHRPPGMDDALHDEALQRGLLRYCPVCDAYEVTDNRVGVIGTSDHGTAEAQFLRGYTADLTLISPDGDHDLSHGCSAALDDAGIGRVAGPCGNYRIRGERLAVETAEGWLEFDSVYPALGSDIRSELAIGIGAKTKEGGCIVVDDQQRASVPGLYAAGDVVLGLDQISYAMGAAAVASTSIRNDLAEKHPIRR